MKGEGRDWKQGRTWSYFVEVPNRERETRNGISFVGQLGEDTNRTWKTISDFLWCTEDSFNQISEILLVSVSDCSSEKIVASLKAEEISQAFLRITWRIH